MNRRRILVLSALMLSLSGLIFASDKNDPTSSAKKFNPTLSESRILSDIYYLASPECEGRGSTTQGIHKAADYIVGQLKQAGLEPAGENGGYFQFFDFTRSGVRVGPNTAVTFKVKDVTVACPKEDLQVLGVGNAGSVESAGLVFGGYGLISTEPKYDDFEGVDLTGKAVVIIRKAPRQDNAQSPNFKGKDDLASLAQKVTNATTKKAAAIIFVNDGVSAKEKDQLVAFSYAGTAAEKGSPPVFQVKRSVIEKILESAGEKSLASLEKQIDEDFKPTPFEIKGVTATCKADLSREPIKLKNIMVTVPGAGDLANEIVVVGSHYDHVGRGETGSLARSKEIHHGADDNASGSVCNLEIARRWHQSQTGPDALKNRRRVIFQWYAAEEWGLIGSDYFVKNPLIKLEYVASMFNLDMVGRYGFDEKKVSPGQNREEVMKRNFPLEVIGVSSAKDFDALVDKANKDLEVNITKPKSSQFFGASDHFSFYKKNIPVIFFFTGMHPQYHRPTDTWDTINIKGIRQCAELGQNILEGLTTMPRPEFQKPAPAAARPAPANNAKVAPGGRAGMRGPRLGIGPAYNDEKEGVLVDSVTADRPAAKAGIKVGDRLLEINGQAVKNVEAYMTVMGKFKAGDKIEILIERKNATTSATEKTKVSVTLE